jgi:small ligand-binding sensory domain FIST
MPNRACARLFLGEFNEESVTQVAREARAELGAEVTCAVVFFSPDYTANLADFLELVRVYGQASLLLGCSAGGLVGPGAEAENQAGFSLLLLSLPRTRVQVCEFSQAQVEAGSGPAFWHLESGVGTEEVDGWIVLTNPVRFDAERWLAEWNQAYPGVPAIGGMASGEAEQIVLCRDGRIIDGDCLALSLSGGLSLRAIVSQGCRPIGEPLTITGAKEKWLLTLGSKPAYTVLNNVFNSLSQPEKDRARHNLFAGLALSEYVEDFKRGDFLIRNILSADPQAGAVAIASAPRVGQTLQYQLRDRDSADEDLRELCYAAEEDGVRPFA